jgi:uncharacterized protein (TIRG00374 family)
MNIKNIMSAVGIIILIYLLSIVDIPAIIEIFSGISPLYAFICLFSVIPIIISTNIQWQILLKKQKIHVSFLYSLKNIFIGYFYGFITPGGFGAYIKALYLKHESGQPLPKCVSNIITFNTLDFLSLLVIGLIGSFFLSSSYPNIFLIIIFVSIIVASLFIFFLRKKKSKIVFSKFVQSNIFSTIKNRLEDPIDTFYENLPSFRDISLPFFLSIFGWIIRFSELYLISKLFDIKVPYISFIFIIAVANIVASLPISIYGLGTREATLISLFSIFAVTSEKIISLSLFWFAVIWLLPSVIGAIITAFESKKLSDFSTKKMM